MIRQEGCRPALCIRAISSVYVLVAALVATTSVARAQGPSADVQEAAKFIPSDAAQLIACDWVNLVDKTPLGDLVDQATAADENLRNQKEQTGFDIRRSIKSVAVGVWPDQKFVIALKGEFDIAKLEAFAQTQPEYKMEKRDVNGQTVYQTKIVSLPPEAAANLPPGFDVSQMPVIYSVMATPGVCVMSTDFDTMWRAASNGFSGDNILTNGALLGGLSKIDQSGQVLMVADLTRSGPMPPGTPSALAVSYQISRGINIISFFGSEQEAQTSAQTTQMQLQMMGGMAQGFTGGDPTVSQVLQESKIQAVGKELHIEMPLTVERGRVIYEKVMENVGPMLEQQRMMNQ